jgi:transposase-like protein
MDNLEPSTEPSCPSCGSDDVRAKSVTIANQQRTIDYVCDGCQHKWSESGPDREQMFAPPT